MALSVSTQKPVQTRILTKLFKETVPEDNHGNPSPGVLLFSILRRSGPEVSEARPDRYPLRGGWEKKVIGIKQKAEKENAEH